MVASASASGDRRTRDNEAGRPSEIERAGGQLRPAAVQGGCISVSAPVAAREDLWLGKIREGWRISELSRRAGLSARRILHGIARARERERASRRRESRTKEAMREQRSGSVAGQGRLAEDGCSRPPRLVPLFPIGPFTPQSACPHRGPVRPGSILCCMVCCQSGMDDHPALKRNPLTDPRPERRRTVSPARHSAKETRKERRRRLYASPQTPPANLADGSVQGVLRSSQEPAD
jgi:hypothetical protein